MAGRGVGSETERARVEPNSEADGREDAADSRQTRDRQRNRRSIKGVPDDASSMIKSAPKERFRWWVILLGVALIPVNSLWIARAEALDYSGFPTCASLFYNVIFCLLVLLALNALLLRFLPSVALCRRELIVLYAMIATGSSLVGHDTMQMVVPTIPHASHFATPENRWNDLIVPRLPGWLTIQTGDAIKHYEQGRSSLYNWDHIRVWLVPAAAWSGFLLCMISSMLCINILLRRHWVEHERLEYPIVQIPLLITEGGGANRMFRDKLLWIGFGIAASIDLWNGFSQFFPAIPRLNTKLTDLSPMFAASPTWRAMGWFPISFYPFVIGLAFFMPSNMAFSSWFFYLFRKLEQVVAFNLGFEGDAWFPYLKAQSYGALIALFAAALWYSRGYLKQMWEGVVQGTGMTEDGGLSYRKTMIVLGIGLAGMMVFLAAAGMSGWLAIIYVLLYMLFLGAITRIRAELGPPSHELGSVGTSQMLILALGTTFVGPQNLTVFSLLYFQNRMHRGILMPQQAECLKAAHESGLKMRTMVIALAVAAVVGVVAAFWALMHLGYGRMYASHHPGAPGSGFSQAAFNQLASWITNPVHANYAGVAAAGIGATIALILARLSVMSFGFPFHPAGFAIGMSFGVDYIWMPILISWLLKVVILRYWGMRGYRAAMPFFVGLVLGEFAVGGLWSFVRGVMGVQTYTFFIF